MVVMFTNVKDLATYLITGLTIHHMSQLVLLNKFLHESNFMHHRTCSTFTKSHLVMVYKVIPAGSFSFLLQHIHRYAARKFMVCAATLIS